MLRGAAAVKVPPQGVAAEFATVNPAGSVSVKATPARATGLELEMVKVSDVFALRAMLVGLKDLAIEGGATTVRIAVLLVAPLPVSMDATVPVALLLIPVEVATTSTEKV